MLNVGKKAYKHIKSIEKIFPIVEIQNFQAAVCRGELYILFLCVTNCGINIVFLMLKG